MELTLLDVCCASGGVSDGFAAEGFRCTGIDIIDAPKLLGYKHKFIQANLKLLKGINFRGFTVIWGSTPCTDFSTASLANTTRRGRRPPDPERGLELISSYRKFVDEANPKIWLMENVRRAEKYHHEKPILHFLISKRGFRTLWGNFNFPMIPDFRSTRDMQKDFMQYKFWEASLRRGRIPEQIARCFARAIKEALDGQI
jgi:site-specific DNA-cytosine methylase